MSTHSICFLREIRKMLIFGQINLKYVWKISPQKGILGLKPPTYTEKKNGMEELKIAAVLVFCVGLANLLLGLSKHPITGQNIPEWAKNPR